jgi:phospholipase/lecithinase/hemolysin
MKLYNIVYLAVAVFFAACSGEPKKIVVMASGKIAQNGDNLTLTPGTTHNEVIFDAAGDKITVTSPAGNKEFDVKESGLYLLNLKKDTLAGSFQKTGTDNSQIKITEEGLWDRVDSLSQLMKGQNVSAANRNYSLAPMAITKVTNNTNAQIIGPHRRLPGSLDPSREHEVYKFYTNKELAEIIAKVKKNMAGRDSTRAN